MRLSVFFFSSGDDIEEDPYELLLRATLHAEALGFEAVWVPERHFSTFGAPFPSPSVLAAGLATATSTIRLRAGSVVLPLNDPLRVVEEWSVVDRLSGGRVGLSFASGWSRSDFVLAPDGYGSRREGMFERAQIVRALWRGETIERPSPGGVIAVSTFPRPVQAELPVWFSSGGVGVNTATAVAAAKVGAGLLTHMVSQTLDDLGARVATYRDTWEQTQPQSTRGTVTVMLHSHLVSTDVGLPVRLQRALEDYLGASLSLQTASRALVPGALVRPSTAREERIRINSAIGRLRKEASLIGSREECSAMLERLRVVGVDEVACLVDFGPRIDEVLETLTVMSEL